MNSEIECLCSAAVVQLSGEPVVQVYCHCDDCQAAHGAAYVANAVYPASAVELVQGTLVPLVVRTARRMRCANCGTFMFTEVASAGLRSVNASRLPKGQFRPQFHVQCQHAILPVVDALPHYKAFPAAFGGSDERVGW
ncbi:MAG: GFA family protein [Solimonas sp.]